MARSNWKGVISFGLVTIPIVLYNSVDPASSISFKMINKKTGDPIKYKRVDAETGREVPWNDIGKGYQYDKETLLPIDENELKRVAGENARVIAIEEFVDKTNIDFLHVENTYYLIPDKKGEKGYVLLREALNATHKVGIAKVIISTKEYLAAVSPYQNALVLYLLHYDEEIRQLSLFDVPSDDIKKYKVAKSEIEIAKKLINSMAKKWKPNKYKDEYKKAVEKWVSEKIKHLPESTMPPRVTVDKKKTNMTDFVTLLKQSLEGKKTAKKNKKKRKSDIKYLPVKKHGYVHKRVSPTKH